MKNRIIAFVLCLSTVFTVAAVPAGALNTDKKSTSFSILEDGYPMPDIGNIIQGFRQVNKLLYDLTGSPCFTDEVFALNVDSTLQGVVNHITESTGVDFSKIYKCFPQTNQYSEWLTTTFKIDTVELQSQLNQAVKELTDQGKVFEAYMVRWLCVWMGIIDECELVCAPVDGQSGVYKIAVKITYRDGRNDYMNSTIYYDENTKQFYGKDKGPAFLGFSMDVSQAMTYTDINVWQRQMGFCLFYDFFCYTTAFINYDTQRIKFNYDDREWMIQIWKGRYLITNGGEVGIYTRPSGSTGSYYNCAGDEDMMTMSLDVYHGDKLLLHRDPTLHWWITGFAISDTTYLPQTLTLVTTITMKDEEMLKAFTSALNKKKLIMKYETEGLNVTITW